MEFNWTTIAWIAGLLFVYIFGLVEGRSKGYKKRKAEEELEKQNRPPAAPEAVTVKVEDPGILRVREEQGAFTLDLDGTPVNPTSLSSSQRKRLIEILNVMRPWLEGRLAPEAPRPLTAAPEARSTIAEPSLPATPSPTSSPALSPSSSPPPSRTPMAESRSERPVSARPQIIAKEDRPSAHATSIVSQIDSVLQARLAGTALEERGIFLTQSPEGTVNVYVGLTRYNCVDEVPDPEVKAASRAAISEWEDKYTPGL